MATLHINNVRKSYKNLEILKGIDLDINDGELVILVGPSGCGKSTLMNCIAGLDDVTEGKIVIAGDDVTYTSPKDRDIAMVFQSYALYPNMTVRKNIGFGLEIRKVPKAEQDEEINRVAELLQINHLMDRKPAALSGGQRQRVAMGRALARRPKIYLFDEPLSNLDAKLRVEMRTEIKKLHKRLSTTIVYVTHDQIEAMTLADRIAVMKLGEVQQFGTPQEIYDNPVNLFVASFIGSPSMNFINCQIEKQGNQLSIELAAKHQKFSIPVPAEYEGLEGYVGKPVILGVRPEQITHVIPHVQNQQNVHLIEAEVEMTEPTGPDTLVIVNLNAKDVECRVHPGEVSELGQKMKLMFNMEKAIFFDPDTENKIG